MARTTRNPNIINNKKSNKWFKKEANKKLRVKNNVLLVTEQFDSLIDSVRSVSNIWTSNKEWKKYSV